MPTYTKEQLIEAVDALPNELRGVLFSSNLERDVQKIGMDSGLLIDQLKELNTLVNYVILGLVSKEELETECQKNLSLNEEVVRSLVQTLDREIFASIEAMEAQEKKEQEFYGENEKLTEENTDSVPNVPSVPSVPNVPLVPPTPHPLDIAPDNLPVAEEVLPLIPPLQPKTLSLSRMEPRSAHVEKEEAPHPFEEKMKRVFTAGKQEMGELAIEPPTAQMGGNEPLPPSRPLRADPYREAIE
ncbi:MAG: hypothetical protein Q7K40_01750 [bacterium]|nr:hypothetical protein [bacterium]